MTSIPDSDYQALQAHGSRSRSKTAACSTRPTPTAPPVQSPPLPTITLKCSPLMANDYWPADSSWTAPPIPKASPGSMPWVMTRASCCRPATAWKETSSYSSRRMKACRDRVYSAPAPGRQCVHSCVDPEPRAHLNLRRDFHKAFTFRSIG